MASNATAEKRLYLQRKGDGITAMSHDILIAYGSKYGSTREIAERIGGVLSRAGLPVVVQPVGEAGDPADYRAVVLGSAIYGSKWRDEAAAYLKQHAGALIDRDVWLFSSGPTGEGDPIRLMRGLGFPEGLQGVASIIHPHDITLFGGRIDVSRLNLVEKVKVWISKAPPGDFRDWDAIDAWAEGIAGALKQGAVT
jgi:menaquinone-dependent protoporphyrinogen oxidase